MVITSEIEQPLTVKNDCVKISYNYIICVWDVCDYTIKAVLNGGELRLSGFAKYAIVDSAIPSCIIHGVKNRFGAVDEEDYLWYFHIRVIGTPRGAIDELPGLIGRCCIHH